MSRSKPSETQNFLEQEDARAGFTIIEALVSLAVVAICLSAIGALMAKNIRGAGKISQHLELVETLRKIETALPSRKSLSTGNLSGEVGDQRWSVDVEPFPVASAASNPTANPPPEDWMPQTVIITLQRPSGSTIQLATLRLTARTAQ
ncbi:MAG: prepilin-type N-terminal cleavage/methylation domain-containing protein [Methylocella sp.]